MIECAVLILFRLWRLYGSGAFAGRGGIRSRERESAEFLLGANLRGLFPVTSPGMGFNGHYRTFFQLFDIGKRPDVPELPEVETMVRGIRPQVEGRRIVRMVACPCDCRPLRITPAPRKIQQRVEGAVITEVIRRAKRVVLRLDTDEAMVIEPRMTGLMLLADPPDPRYLRLRWELSDGKTHNSLWFWDRRGLGTVRLFTRDEYEERLGPRYLGFDALEMTAAEWKTRLARTSRAVKVALLDQKLVAGIGNLYASEILHRAGIHPERPAEQVTSAQIKRLTESVLHVLNEAIRYEGSTLGDGTYRNALNGDGNYQNKHTVYMRHDEQCGKCGRGRIRRIVQAQRSTFFCPVCQRR